MFVDAAQEVFLSGLLGRAGRREMVERAFLLADRRIREKAEEPGMGGMGCTAELLALDGTTWWLGHLGDSRTYLFDGKGLRRLTKDHTFVQEELDRGAMTQEEARRHRLRHVLSKAVGHMEELEIDVISGALKGPSIFLLCSDGLTDELEDREIEAALDLEARPGELAEALVDAALRHGGRDNVTAVVVKAVPEEGRGRRLRAALRKVVGG